MTIPAPTSWDAIAAAKRAARDALIPADWKLANPPADDVRDVTGVPATCGILSPKEVAITETAGSELVRRMVAKELTSEEVTVAFCKRAAIAQQLTNCLTEILFDQAIAAAKALDAAYAETGAPAGPLHGLPVSLKDNFNIAGLDSTVGFVAWVNDPQWLESEMTKLMRESGAILFVKTNVPTAMMMPESYNNVWGYTSNPYNRLLSSGGSSGGESALLALKGSPLGVGTDIGGSIRIPASFCGLFALKPSFGRFPTYGARSGMPGQEAVRSINGPMSADLSAVELWAKTVVDSEPWLRDPNMIPLPWRAVDLPEQLVFGLITDNGLVRPLPPVTRALAETKAALEAAGHRVVEWSPYDAAQADDLGRRFFTGDGGVKIASTIAAGSEPWPAGMTAYKTAYEMGQSTPPTVGDLWTLQGERLGYVKKALDHWLASKDLTGTGRPFDAVLSPTTPYAAAPIHTCEHVAYTLAWNLSDQAAAIVPVTRAKATDAKPAAPLEYRSPVEQRIWDRYDPEEVAGAPVALQVITMRLEEEKALKLAGVVADAIKAAA